MSANTGKVYSASEKCSIRSSTYVVRRLLSNYIQKIERCIQVLSNDYMHMYLTLDNTERTALKATSQCEVLEKKIAELDNSLLHTKIDFPRISDSACSSSYSNKPDDGEFLWPITNFKARFENSDPCEQLEKKISEFENISKSLKISTLCSAISTSNAYLNEADNGEFIWPGRIGYLTQNIAIRKMLSTKKKLSSDGKHKLKKNSSQANGCCSFLSSLSSGMCLLLCCLPSFLNSKNDIGFGEPLGQCQMNSSNGNGRHCYVANESDCMDSNIYRFRIIENWVNSYSDDRENDESLWVIDNLKSKLEQSNIDASGFTKKLSPDGKHKLKKISSQVNRRRSILSSLSSGMCLLLCCLPSFLNSKNDIGFGEPLEQCQMNSSNGNGRPCYVSNESDSKRFTHFMDRVNP